MIEKFFFNIKRFSYKKKIQYMIFWMLIGGICYLAAWKPGVSFVVTCEENVAVKIYYDNQKEDMFDQRHSSQSFLIEKGCNDKIVFEVGNNRQIKSLRIDVSYTEKSVGLSDLKVDYYPLLTCIVDSSTLKSHVFTHNIKYTDFSNEKIYLSLCGEDAYLYFPDIKAIISKGCFSVNWLFVIRFVGNILVVYLGIKCWNRSKKVIERDEKEIVRIAEWVINALISAALIEFVCIPLINNFIVFIPFENLRLYFLSAQSFSLSRYYFLFIVQLVLLCIRFLGGNYVYQKRFWLIAILFILLVLGKFSYSSINAYDLMLYGNTSAYKNPTVLGRAQGIRADEWAVEKPYYFAQAAEGVGFPYYNDNLMISGADMMVMAAAPVKDLMILTHPALLGFLFLPIEYAFSFYWNFRILSLFMSAFELGNILFKRRKYAFAFALSLLFSAPIQWMLSQWLIDIIIWGQVAVVIWFKLIVANKVIVRALMSVLLAGALNCYIYVMYPAAQVPFAYFFLGCVLVTAYKHKGKKPFSPRMWPYYLSAVIIVMTFAGYFVYKSSSALSIMMNTVYPGQNRVWGTYSWDYELLPFMNLLTAICKDSPYLNNTETAQFIYFVPHIIIASIWLKKKNRHDTDVKTLCCLESIILFFEIMTKVPERTFLSKLLLLDVSYPRRMQLVVGYGFLIIMWLVIDISFNKNIAILKVKSWNIIIFTVTIFLTLYSPTLREYFGIGQSYVGTSAICSLVGLYTCIGAWILNQKKHEIFVTVYLFICILTTCWVNPVINSMDCIFEKSSVKAVQEIAKNNKDRRWITSGNAGIGNMISSLGIKRCSGYYYYPDIDMMSTIDPNLRYKELWNSFSAIDMRLTYGDNYVESINNDVALTVWINKETAEKLGIEYIFSINYDYTDLEEKGDLQLLYKDIVDEVSIYQIVHNK